jgi:hypothetical protein
VKSEKGSEPIPAPSSPHLGVSPSSISLGSQDFFRSEKNKPSSFLSDPTKLIPVHSAFRSHLQSAAPRLSVIFPDSLDMDASSPATLSSGKSFSREKPSSLAVKRRVSYGFGGLVLLVSIGDETGKEAPILRHQCVAQPKNNSTVTPSPSA